MTKLATIQPNTMTGGLPSRSRPALTQEQVFRLLRCAIKDDDDLVDEIIEQVYENIVAFDYKRAECVIELIVRRSVTARWAFRSLLKDMRTADTPVVFIAPSSVYSESRHGSA